MNIGEYYEKRADVENKIKQFKRTFEEAEQVEEIHLSRKGKNKSNLLYNPLQEMLGGQQMKLKGRIKMRERKNEQNDIKPAINKD